MGVVPETWPKKNIFTMLPKFKRALQPADFRPVVFLRLLYKTFVYMTLGRIEKQLDTAQPEEQHGFHANYCIEEHWLTANFVIDKTVATGEPVWIVTLALSKSFDHVHWGSLWQALRQHEVSNHMVWILQCLYHDQVGTVPSSSGTSHPSDIRQGVRQGCVLSPRLFACVLQWALRSWRARSKHSGLNFGMAWHHFWIFVLRTIYSFLRFQGKNLFLCWGNFLARCRKLAWSSMHPRLVSRLRHNHPQVYACKMGPKCLCYRMIVATNRWVVF